MYPDNEMMNGRMFYKFFLICTLTVVGLFATTNAKAFHPFYVSVTEVNYNAKSGAIEISCKMFVDDFENILKQNYKTSVNLGNDQQQTQPGKLVNDYIQRRLVFSFNNKPAAMQFVGFEKDSESVYCYFEIPAVGALKNVSLHNSILFDYQQEQINIIHITVNGKRQSTRLNNPNSRATFTF